jgi:hypothetical protein
MVILAIHFLIGIYKPNMHNFLKAYEVFIFDFFNIFDLILSILFVMSFQYFGIKTCFLIYCFVKMCSQ